VLKYYYVIKSEPWYGSDCPICSLTGAHIAPVALVQSYQEVKNEPSQNYIYCYAEVKFASPSFAAPSPGLRNELLPLPEPRFAHRENYYRQGPNNQKFDTKLNLNIKRTRSLRGSNVWAIQQYQKTFLEISWDYPFKSWTTDVVITVGKKHLGSPNMYCICLIFGG
jgi:hypothetical protein